MYEIFIEGVHHAGLKDDELSFFYVHLACDGTAVLVAQSRQRRDEEVAPSSSFRTKTTD
jgi:hypothetical protein